MKRVESPYFSPPPKPKRPPPVKICYSDMTTPPSGWEKCYENIQTMRKERSAPVDTMGCERAHDQEATPQVQRFQCLVSLMLSSQTKDEVNYAAMLRLREHGLTVENILNTEEEKLGQLGIFPVKDFWPPPLPPQPSKFVQILQYSTTTTTTSTTTMCLAPAGGPKARDGHHVSA